LAYGGHIGHRATCSHIGQYNFDVQILALFSFFGAIGKDVGCFGHEVHAAKDDVTAIGTFGGEFAQLVRVTG
jgi:hypothetical protein